MFEILEKRKIADNTFLFVVRAPLIARSAKAGQFLTLRIDEKGERIPLTIADSDAQAGSVTIVFQVVGASTALLAGLEPGDAIRDVLGPLGHATEIADFGTVVCVGGGVGIAVVYPVVKAMKAKGNAVVTIIGARNKAALILEEESRRHSDELIVTTDDGSAGRKGFVTDALQDLIAKGVKVARVIAVGPVPMMKAVANVTRPHGIRTVVSLNPIMLDATGMCGACRVSVAGATRFACVDGPEFDGHQVDFDELSARLGQFRDMERTAMKRCEAGR